MIDEVHAESKRAVSSDSVYLKVARSGALIPVSYDPATSGQWDTLNDGTKIWRAGFCVNDASMMNIQFYPYKIQSGVRVFLYDPEQQHVIGALSDLNNKPYGKLATSNIPGNTMIVEMQVPAYCDEYGELGISGIGCDFGNFDLYYNKDAWYGASGSCNPDIQCSSDMVSQIVKNSVVRIIFNGHERCTGTLVNSTHRKKPNYILTAGHCFTTFDTDKKLNVPDEEAAKSAVFYFEYESPYCSGPDGSTTKALSGATIRAWGDDIDFVLLELLEPVPLYYNPYYAGWDYRNAIPGSGIVIHHPFGDVKKYAVEQHPLTITSYEGHYKNNSHWLVWHWELGTTEAGSSGSPFFDTAGRIRGTLTGGRANCDFAIQDYFQMFSHSWHDYSSSDRQLAVWLDPFNSTDGYLDGFDPYAELKTTGDTLSNISENEKLTVESNGLLWGSYSGHNNLNTSGFAEKFETSAKAIIGINLFVRNNHVAMPSRFLNIKVWSGTSFPEEVIYEQKVYLNTLIPGIVNSIAFDSAVQPGRHFFAGFELSYHTIADTFSVYMAENRSVNGQGTAFVSDGNTWYTLNDYTAGLVNSSFAIYPVVYGSLPEEEGSLPDDFVTAFPNPASSVVLLKFREIQQAPVRITMFNMQGQTVFEQEYSPHQHIIPVNLRGIPVGLYILKVKSGGKPCILKVSVVK